MILDKVSSLYIHIPFCLSKCKYCDFFSVPDSSYRNSIPQEYVSALVKELDFTLKKYHVSKLETVYIGGGTPSLLSKDQLEDIFKVIRSSVEFSETPEITIEMNPDDVTEDKLCFYKQIGINRISCGIQSLEDSVLGYMSRRANCEMNLKALNLLSHWYGKFSIDLICGLPYETENSFLKGLETVISFNPDHISMYSLTIEDETPLGKLVLNGEIEIDYDSSDLIWLKARDYLEETGYFQYEVSNFAKPNFECKHNLVYWNHESYLGVGCGATGTIYAENGEGNRVKNENQLHDYIRFWSNPFDEAAREKFYSVETIDIDSSIFEFFMMGLRKLSGVKESDFYRCFHQKIPDPIVNNFYSWQKKSLCEIKMLENDRVFRMNKNGIMFLNKFLEEII